MVVILRSRRNMIYPTKNGLMKGGSVVLERHEFNAKEPMVETKNSKTFTHSGQKVLKDDSVQRRPTCAGRRGKVLGTLAWPWVGVNAPSAHMC